MGCILSRPPTNEPQTSNGGSRSKPPWEPCFRFSGTSKTQLGLAARASELHGHAVANISNGGSVTKFRNNPVIREVLQSDREMEISEATKGRGLRGKMNKFVVKNLKEEFAMVDIAKEIGADAVSHGCTGKGNNQELESLSIDRESLQLKDSIALKYAELVAGRWFDPLRESMDAFMQKITETTAGSVSVTGRKSPYSLYRQDISSFESSQIYDQADAAGFIRLYGLPMRV